MKKKKIRLAINAVPLAPGGGMVVLLGYLKAWQDNKAPLKITIFASKIKLIEAIKTIHPNIEIVPFALDESPWRHFILQQTRLGPEIGRRNPDILLNTQYGVWNSKVPQIVHHQNLKRFLIPSLWSRMKCFDFAQAIKDYAARVSLKKSAYNIHISKYMQSAAESLVPDSAARNITIHNGISKQLIDKYKQCKPTWNGQPTILAIQDASEHKDNPTLIRTLSKLVAVRPDLEWKLEIAGGGDWTSVKSLARDLGIYNRITFHGYLDHKNLGMLLHRSLCLVFTSILEGFGNPPLEAMAHHCPVIACNCTAMPEVIGNAGILVAPGNAEEFAKAVISLHSNVALRNRIIDEGLKRIQQFTWEKSAEQMIKVFEKVIYNETNPATFKNG